MNKRIMMKRFKTYSQITLHPEFILSVVEGIQFASQITYVFARLRRTRQGERRTVHIECFFDRKKVSKYEAQSKRIFLGLTLLSLTCISNLIGMDGEGRPLAAYPPGQGQPPISYQNPDPYRLQELYDKAPPPEEAESLIQQLTSREQIIQSAKSVGESKNSAHCWLGIAALFGAFVIKDFAVGTLLGIKSSTVTTPTPLLAPNQTLVTLKGCQKVCVVDPCCAMEPGYCPCVVACPGNEWDCNPQYLESEVNAFGTTSFVSAGVSGLASCGALCMSLYRFWQSDQTEKKLKELLQKLEESEVSSEQIE